MSDERATLVVIACALRAAADILDPPPVPVIVVTPVPVPGPPPPPPVHVPVLPPIQSELAALYADCLLSPGHALEISGVVARILAAKDVYEQVQTATGVPWYVVAALHSLEADLDFKTHLFNGDPLSARTVHVPAGQPTAGHPPFTWAESAIASLAYDKLSGQSDWSLGRLLDRVERYNGLGYRYRGAPSPYLWSYTNHYTKGKFIADGQFDPNAVSEQAGAAALIKYMQLSGVITL